MNQWLAAQAELLAMQTGVDRAKLELAEQEMDMVLNLAAMAAEESGARTNAPLFCFLLGVVHGHGATLEEMAELVRSTS